ncbi:MAG: hypothetical protein JXA54_15615 [Candidatus Heimdallarchaeota archaeon]|nr:hypothetical protein [Candidatus Heimdallarchaeota archaeon]
MAISKSEFKKHSNPEFSLLEEEWRKFKTKWIILIIFISVLFIPFLGIIALLIDANQSYNYIKMLQNRVRVDKLMEVAELHVDQYKTQFSLYALVDMKVKDVAFLLNDFYEDAVYLSTNFHKKIQKLLTILAVKLDYISVEEMLRLLEKPTKKYHINPNITITSVYYLEQVPQKTKCMISSLFLDFDKDTIVACPNCGNFAKKDLLAEWLEENGSCRICERKISIDDCPIVKIRE